MELDLANGNALGTNGQLADFWNAFQEVHDSKPSIITEWSPTLYATTHQCNSTQSMTRITLLYSFSALICLVSKDTTGGPSLIGLLAAQVRCWLVFSPHLALVLLVKRPTSCAPCALLLDNQLTFSPGSLDYNISGLPPSVVPSTFAGGQSALFQNSSGTFFLYLWNAQLNPGGSGSAVSVTFNSAI